MSLSTYAQRYATLDSTTAGAFVFDTIAAQDWPVTKLAFGAVGSVTHVSASDPLPVTAGLAAHDAAVSGNPVLQGGYASAAAPSDVSGDGDAVRAWHLRNGAGAVVLTAAGALIPGDATNGLDVDVIRLPSSTNTLEVVGDAAHDAAAAGNPILVGGYASATAPSDVSANADAVRAWYLLNGAQACVITAAGALIGGDATNGLDVDLTNAVTDNAAFTDGTSKVLLGGYIYDETPGTALTENDAAAARIDSKRALVGVIEDETTRGRRATVTSSNALKVDNSAVTQPVNITQYLGAAASLTNPIHVIPGTSATFTVTQSTASSLKCEPVGNVAHDAADSGNPVKVGGKGRTTHPTAVADADRTDLYTDDLGRIVVVDGVPRDLIAEQTTTISASTAETTILTAGSAGVFHDLTAIWAINTSATATRLDFRDATAGTVRFSLYLPAGDTRVVHIVRPVKQTTAANNWTATCGTSVTDVRIFVQAEKNN